jgi:hypothetical protein
MLTTIVTQAFDMLRSASPAALGGAAAALFAVPLVVVRAMRRRAARRRADMAAQTAPQLSRGEWANRVRAREGADQQAPTPALGSEEDPAWRLQTVAAMGFRVRPMINRSQERLLPILERLTYTRGDGHRLVASAALTELVQPVAAHGVSPERLARATRAVQCQRLDFVLLDAAGLMVAAIEVRTPRLPGQSDEIGSALRREVLRKANVPLHRIAPHATEAEIASILLPHLAPAKAG